MAHKLDPHHLVALMSYTCAKKQDGSGDCLDGTSLNLEYGIIDDHETNIRTFPILDALARVCVHGGKSQVVAMALQVDPREQKIHLIIAENQGVNSEVVAHLNSVWEKLQALSKAYEARRERESGKEEQQLPDALKDVILSLKVAIFREICKFTVAKQKKRIDKWWAGLIDFMVKLLKLREEDPEGIEEVLYEAVSAFHLLLQLVRRLHENPSAELTQDEWQQVYLYSAYASEKARLVLADTEEFDCESLAQELNDSPRPNDAFLLRHALEKLTSLAHDIECLFKFAHSRRLLPGLRYHISISTVPEQNRNVELPRSQEQWLSILEVAAAKSLVWQRGYARILSDKFQQQDCLCPVHPECRLVQYLVTSHGNQWDHVPAFSYIGVSKPSCSACGIWMEAFNEMGRRKFYTRRSQGKWYWPWAMPPAKEPLGEVMAGESSQEIMPKRSLDESIARKISHEYIAYLKEQNLFESGSLSTGFDGAKSNLAGIDGETLISGFAVVDLEFEGSLSEYLDSFR